jgi:CheY-like chemotaxis protein
MLKNKYNFRMKNFLQKIFARNSLNEVQLLDALCSLVGFAKLKNILEQSKDPRELIDNVLVSLSDSDSRNIQKLSKKLNLACLVSIPQLSIEQSERHNLEQLMQVGAIPIYQSDCLVGYAVANPIFFATYHQDEQKQKIFLASWKKIRLALEASQKQFFAHTSDMKNIIKRKQEEMLNHLILNIYKECQGYEVNDFVIKIQGESSIYEFNLKDSRKGRGQINSKISNILNQYLKELANTKQGEFCIEELSPNEIYRVSSKKELSNLSQKQEPNALKAKLKQEQGDRKLPIMIIEDNPAFRKVLLSYLGKYNFSISFACDGLEALEQLERVKPLVLVSDLIMPNMTGHELVKKIRHMSEPFNTIPVIILSSDDSIDTQLELIEYGVDVFLSKTADPRLLLSHLKRLTKKIDFEKKIQRAA